VITELGDGRLGAVLSADPEHDCADRGDADRDGDGRDVNQHPLGDRVAVQVLANCLDAAEQAHRS
jgi:hypothetical protein